MPEYKLVYFTSRGLGELIRWLFKYGDIPFTDERIEYREDFPGPKWPELKKTIPGGKLPLLYIDGKPLWQSMAIGRYVATLAGLTLNDPVQAAYCDAFVETSKELLTAMYDIIVKEKSQEEKDKEMREEYLPRVVIPVLEKINKRMETREWLVGDKVTWADLAFSRSMEDLMSKFGDDIKKFPAALAHATKIQELPRIKEWRAKRPITDY